MTLARRLRGRSFAELRERARQFALARGERVGVLPHLPPHVERLRSVLRPEVRAVFTTDDAWSQGLLGGGFFPGAMDAAGVVRRASTVDPGFAAACVERAGRAIRGRFTLLGHDDLAWPLPIDWRLDPVAGRTSDLSHWSEVPYLDEARVGDHKVIWELNRHQWLVTLAQAFRATGDATWRDAVWQALRDWLDANPAGRGINWASSLEVSYRAIAWLWALRILGEAPPPHLAVRIAAHFLASGRHLSRYLSTYFSPNTHLTGEALGLVYLGTQLPQFREATTWKQHGWRILHEQAARQVRSDGVYFEQAFWYHRYTVDIYLHAIILGRENGLTFEAGVGARVELALEFLQAILRPAGDVPLVGDDDGGKLVVLDARPLADASATLAEGALLFGHHGLVATAPAPGLELEWMLGPNARESLTRLDAGSPPERHRLFPVGGFATMRSSWDANAAALVVDLGPHGVLNCGHAHADALSIDLSVGGVPVLVDPGTGTYSSADPDRRHLRTSQAHNTITLDGRSASIPAGPFQWSHIAACDPTAWAHGDGVTIVQGTHDGYRNLPVPAAITRTIVFADAGYVLVVDAVDSDGPHAVESGFQVALGLTVEARGSGHVIRGHGRDLAGLRVVCSPGAVGTTVEMGTVSPAYGVRHRAPRVTYRWQSTDQHTHMALLATFGSPDALSVRPLGDALLVEGPFGQDVLRVGARRPWTAGALAGDVEVAFARLTAEGALERSLACGGGSWTHDGAPLPITSPLLREGR